MSGNWAKLPERGNLTALRLIHWITLHMGRPAGRALLYPITFYFLLTATAARRGSQLYLRRVLGRKPRLRDLFRHIHCFAATLLDRLYFLSGRLDRFDVRLFNDQLILDQAASGQGCLLLGSHLGSFEALRALGVTVKHFPIRILMNTEHNQGMTRYLSALNPALAETVISISGGPDSLLKVQESVAQGCMVGALGDRVVPGEKTVQCRFFGQDTPFPAGPLLLAALTGCPVILFFGLYRGNNRYDAHFELLAERIDLDRCHRQEQLAEWAQRYADRLEHYARLAPYNWFNFYDYWAEDAP
jgi:predicted LPLAT superfamily acyltransferase